MKNKLRTYHKFKSAFAYEKYLGYGSDFGQRKILTKLRISAHSLEIEVGCHKVTNGQRILPENHTCSNGKTTEDEYHLVMTCKPYIVERKIMLDKIAKHITGFMGLHVWETFQHIMKSDTKNHFGLFQNT